MTTGLLILLTALLIVGLLLFITAAVDRGGKEPSPVRLIAMGLACWILVALIQLLEAASKAKQ
jgi:hypothetical protein